MSLVWELDLPQNLKFVLLGFADHANDNGLCWPSIKRIAWKSGYSERQVQHIVRKLRDKHGLLEAVRYERGGRGLATVYRVRSERGKKLSPFVAEKGAETAPFYEKGCGPAQQRVQPAAQKGAVAIAPQPSLTVEEPPEERESAGADVALSPSGCSARFMELWNEHCGTLPKVREITESRRRKLAARCRERPDFEQEFLAATQRAAQTPFLLGENERGWRANFDWLIRSDTNLVGILEGKYDGEGGRHGARRTGKRNGSSDPDKLARFRVGVKACDFAQRAH